jgi:hypothetical protein
MILGDRLDVIGSRFFLRLRLAKRERTARHLIPSRLTAMPRRRPKRSSWHIPARCRLIAHADLGKVSDRSPALIGFGIDPGTVLTTAPIGTKFCRINWTYPRTAAKPRSDTTR